MSEIQRILTYCQDMAKDPSNGPLSNVTNLVTLIVNAGPVVGQRAVTVTLYVNAKSYDCDMYNIGLARIIKNDNVVGVIHGSEFIGLIDGVLFGLSLKFDPRDEKLQVVSNFEPTIPQLLKWCEIMPASRIIKYFNDQLSSGVGTKVVAYETDIGLTINGKTKGQLELTKQELDKCNRVFTMGQTINLEIDLDDRITECIERMIRLSTFVKPLDFSYDQIIQYLTLIDVLGLTVIC